MMRDLSYRRERIGVAVHDQMGDASDQSSAQVALAFWVMKIGAAAVCGALLIGRRPIWSSAAALALVIGLMGGYRLYLLAIGNFHPVAHNEVYRSAQPSPERLAAWTKAYGLKAVLNLRGAHPGAPWYDTEVAAARQLGLQLIDYRLSSDIKITAQQADELTQILKAAPKPLLIHCRQGADRSGFVSALYLAGIAKVDEATAEAHLSFLYGHVSLPIVPAFAMDESWEEIEPRMGFPAS